MQLAHSLKQDRCLKVAPCTCEKLESREQKVFSCYHSDRRALSLEMSGQRHIWQVRRGKWRHQHFSPY